MRYVHYKQDKYGEVIGGVMYRTQDTISIPVEVMDKLSHMGAEKICLTVDNKDYTYTLKEVVEYGHIKEAGIIKLRDK